MTDLLSQQPSVRSIEFAHCVNKEKEIFIEPTPVDEGSFCELVNSDANGRVVCTVCHKAVVPLAKLRDLFDLEEEDKIPNYRCTACAKCTRCKESGKLKAMGIRERVEQEVIEDSISIDYNSHTVLAKLSFMIITKWPKRFTCNSVKSLIIKRRGLGKYTKAL